MLCFLKKLESQVTPIYSLKNSITAPLPELSTFGINLPSNYIYIYIYIYKADFAEFQEDIRIWKNRLRWAVYHDLKKSKPDNISHDDETSPIEFALIKSNKSKFSAPLSKNLALEFFL